MKKIITAMLLLLSITVFAQEKESRRADISDDEMATLRAKRLAMQLDLTEEQEAKLKSFYAKQINERREIIDDRKQQLDTLKKERLEMRQELLEMNAEKKVELQEILTEEQYIKWEQLQEKRRKGRDTSIRKKEN